MLCKFYFETDEYRKDNDKLTWFGEREGNLGWPLEVLEPHLASGTKQCPG